MSWHFEEKIVIPTYRNRFQSILNSQPKETENHMYEYNIIIYKTLCLCSLYVVCVRMTQRGILTEQLFKISSHSVWLNEQIFDEFSNICIIQILVDC